MAVDERDLRDVFARNLRARRAFLGITQEELATQAGVDRGVISSYETGSRLPAGLVSIASICEVLGMSVDEALGL